MRELLGLGGALVIAVSAVYYVVDVLRGGTKPQRASWAVWATVGVLGFSATRDGGAGPGAWAAGVDASACAVTFALSLNPRYGKSGGSRCDRLLVVAGVCGVLLWRWGVVGLTGAAICAVACDAVALWPTLREAWRQPGRESLLSWAADLLGHGLAVAAVASYSVASVAYPAYALLATAAVVAVLALRRTQLRRARTMQHSARVDPSVPDGSTRAMLPITGTPEPAPARSRARP